MGLPDDLIWPWDPGDEEDEPLWGPGPYARPRVAAPTAREAAAAREGTPRLSARTG